MNKIILLVILVISLGLVGCKSVDRGASTYKDIYNDKESQVKLYDSFDYHSMNRNTSDDKLEISFKRFSGTDTLAQFRGASVRLNLKMVQKSGRLKLIVISPENEIVYEMAGNLEDKIDLDLEEGNYRVKLVGEKARGNVNLRILGGDSLEIR